MASILFWGYPAMLSLEVLAEKTKKKERERKRERKGQANYACWGGVVMLLLAATQQLAYCSFPKDKLIERASAVVVGIGINGMKFRSNDEILRYYSAKQPGSGLYFKNNMDPR